MISAGRVLLMPKGDYDSTATYEMLDIVSYNGSSYIAKSTTTGNLPTNTTYWQLSAYGGQAANLAGNFAPLETTDYASRAYAIDDIFVDKSSQLVIATTTINIGDEIEIGSNCDATTMSELLDAIENRYDALDQRNRKLVGINPITIQTDLHLLAPGEYFKKLTNFYVTNAPTGINQVPTAVFRLTVEGGLDESGSSLILTLRTLEGATYTQVYNGTSWSDWEEVANKAYVDGQIGSLGTAAAKDSTNAVTSGSTDLVESGAVYTEIQTLTNQIATKADSSTVSALANDVDDMNNVLGAKNLLPNVRSGSETIGGVTFTVNSDGSITVNGTATDNVSFGINSVNSPSQYIKPSYYSGNILSGSIGGSANTYYMYLVYSEDGSTYGGTILCYDGDVIIPDKAGYKNVVIHVKNGTVMNNVVFYPMIRPASIEDDTYVPYSMTNQEMTPYVQAISNPNLLDNPWFTVNQRGESSYLTTAQYQYTLDRWYCYYADTQVTINSDGSITIGEGPSSSRYEYFRQKLETDLTKKLYGKTITVSAIDGNGKLWKATGTVPSSVSSSVNVALVRVKDTSNVEVGQISCSLHTDGYLYVDIISETGYTITVKAVKLELGSVSTLAMDTAPNYATELLKCQRYFYRHKGAYEYVGYFNTATNFRANLALPVPMRAIPSMTLETPTDYAQCLIYDAQGNAVQPSAIAVDTVNSIVGQPEILLNSTVATHTQNMCGVQRFNLRMDLSADR